MVPSSHLGLLRLGGRPVGDPLQVLDGVGAVGPAVGVDDVLVDATAATLDGLPEILFTGQHSREENEERKCGLLRKLD